MGVADINIRIGASIEALRTGLSKAEKAMKRSAAKFSKIGTDLSQKVSLPILGIGAAALKAAGDFQQLEAGLTAVIGDADKAKQELQLLQQAAASPGLSFEQAVQGSIRLQAVKFNAEQARETMLQFGNAIAIVGGTSDDLNAVTQQITQMVSKNRILQEDFGVLQERVPLISQALEGAFGTTNIDNIRKSGISAQEFIGKIVTELSKLERVDGGINNAFVNLANAGKSALATIGAEINKTLKVQQVLERLAGIIQNVANRFTKLSEPTKRFIIIAAGIAAAIGPVLLGIGSMISLLPIMGAGLAALISPVTGVIAVIGLLTAGIVKTYKENDIFRARIQGTLAALKEFAIIIKEVVVKAFGGLAKIMKGEVREGLQDVGQAFIDGNPIGLITKGGVRMAQAFNDGFKQALVPGVAETTKEAANAIAKVNTSQIFSNFTGPGSSSGASFSRGNTDIAPSIESRNDFSLGGVESTSLTNPLEEALPKIQAVSTAYQGLGTRLADIALKNSLLGNSNNTLTEQISATKNAITQAIDEGWSPQSNVVQAYTGQLEELNSKQFETLSVFDQFNVLLSKMANGPAKSLAEAMGAASQAMVQAAQSGETSFRKLGQAALAGAAQVARAKLIEAVTSIAADAFAKLGIFGLALASGAGALAGGVFNRLISNIGIPALAEGGIVNRPTLSLIGEAGPEAVIPLSKLNDIGGGTPYILESRISGTDLMVLLKRVEQIEKRIG